MTDWRDSIRNENCSICTLHESAEYVCLMGNGPQAARLMIVGEAPGAREDESHRAFVGPAGKLLSELLQEVGIDRESAYITNAVKCRPPDNRTPERKEVKACSTTYLSQEIQQVQPEFVLMLGNSALQAVAGKSGITKHRGTPFVAQGYTAFGTFHPAAVLRNPSYRTAVMADLERLARMLKGEASKAPPTATKIVSNAKQLRWLINNLSVASTISYDIETYTHDGSNFEEWHGDRSCIVSISFSWKPGQAAVLLLHHEMSPWEDPDRVLQLLKPCLERPDAKYIAHNGKFDARWLAAKGIKVPQTFDTMLAAHMLDENRLKGLKPLSQLLLGADAYDVGDDLADAFHMPPKRLCIYNGKDTDYTLRLYHVFRDQLIAEPRTARLFQKLMMPASNVLVDIEGTGIGLDLERVAERKSIAERNVEKLERAMLKLVPEHKRDDFNFNSHQQIAQWLFVDLGLPIIERTGKGAPSSKESVLLQLRHESKAVEALLLYRGWVKWLGFLNNWATNNDNGRLHGTYKLFGTVTGRLSCQNPNLQQVPRDPFMRPCFGAPEGWLFVQADYSQVELRIAAMIANEKRMLRMFASGEDIHMNTACATTGKMPDEITKEERKKAKGVNFGFLYGMGAHKFVDYARDSYDVIVSEDEAERVRERFFEAYPALRPWHERQRRIARRHQRVTSPLGRTRHLPDIISEDKMVRADAERQAINSPVQGTASDIMLTSLIELHRAFNPKRARIVGTVHDSILFEVREEHLQETCHLIKNTMENPPIKRRFGADITVPLVADIEVGRHWGENDLTPDEFK